MHAFGSSLDKGFGRLVPALIPKSRWTLIGNVAVAQAAFSYAAKTASRKSGQSRASAASKLRGRYGTPQRRRAGHREVGQAARHDPAEMRQIGGEVDRKAVQRDPALHAHADRADLRLAPRRRRSRCRPRPARANARRCRARPAPRSPSLRAHGRSSARRARACRGRAPDSRPAAPARDRCSARRARYRHTGKRGSISSAGSALVPGGVDRRMFEQPDQLARLARGDRRGARLHLGQRSRHRRQAGRDAPFDIVGDHRRARYSRRAARRKSLASVAALG